MYGADDPYCRAPMWWEEVAGAQQAGYRADLRQFYQELTGLRRGWKPLSRGDFRVLLADDRRRVVVFARRWQEEQVIVVLNGGTRPARVTLNLGLEGQTVSVLTPGAQDRHDLPLSGENACLGPGGTLALTCPPFGTRLVITHNQFSLNSSE